MKTPIEFQKSNTTTTADLIARWPQPKPPFEDRIPKGEYSDAKGTLPVGTSTVRILPPLRGSSYWWLPIHALTYPSGQHAHPKTHEANAQSVFDVARDWLKKNEPRALYTKASGKGFKLWSQPMAACWLLVTHNGKTKLKLVIASAFAGTRDRQPGLAHQLMRFVQRNIILLDADTKHAMEITRSQPEDSNYLQTSIKLIDTESTLNEGLAELPSEEIRMVCPVEQTIRKIEEEDEWKLLEKAIGSPWVERIRSAPQQNIT